MSLVYVLVCVEKDLINRGSGTAFPRSLTDLVYIISVLFINLVNLCIIEVGKKRLSCRNVI